PDAELDRIARICLGYRVDGLRADIVVARTAVALAAWHGRTVVTRDDVRDAARLALPHRRRRDPLDPPGADLDRLEELLAEETGPEDEPPPPEGPGGADPSGPPDGGGPPPPPPPPPPAPGRPPAEA